MHKGNVIDNNQKILLFTTKQALYNGSIQSTKKNDPGHFYQAFGDGKFKGIP